VPPPPDNVHGAPPQQHTQGAAAAVASSRTSVQARHRLDFDAIEPASALAATQTLIRNPPGLSARSEAEVQWRLARPAALCRRGPDWCRSVTLAEGLK
jgi:hypothetical protein